MSTLPQPPYVYATQAEAEAASNALYLAQNPSGTTELLYGWFINGQGLYQLAVPDDTGTTPAAPATPVTTQTPQMMADAIDTLVAGVYSTWTRFQAEYDARLAAAQAFQAANYQGDPGTWVSAYATAAGVTNEAAAQTIIAEGATLDTALQQLGALRMQKYAILAAATTAAATTLYDNAVTSINQIAASLS